MWISLIRSLLVPHHCSAWIQSGVTHLWVLFSFLDGISPSSSIVEMMLIWLEYSWSRISAGDGGGISVIIFPGMIAIPKHGPKAIAPTMDATTGVRAPFELPLPPNRSFNGQSNVSYYGSFVKIMALSTIGAFSLSQIRSCHPKAQSHSSQEKWLRIVRLLSKFSRCMNQFKSAKSECD